MIDQLIALCCAEIYRLISRKAVTAGDSGSAAAAVGASASIVLTAENTNDGKDGPDGKSAPPKGKCACS